MYNFIKITTVLAIFLLGVFSCRSTNEVPEDIHEHEEIGKMVMTITNKNNPADIKIIQYIGGQASAALQLTPGQSYLVSLDFQTQKNGVFTSVLDEIIEEKEEHFLTFQFANANIKITRASNDIARADGKKIGLQTEWNVMGVDANGKVTIKLVHAATSVDDMAPTADNQLGTTVGGESDVDATLDL